MSIDWRNYLLRNDFTEHADLLSAIPEGELNESGQRAIAAALNASGPMAQQKMWNQTEMTAEYSLNGAVVLYNGLNDREFATLSLFKYALRVKFPEWSTAPVGDLFLCWNDPVVPTDTDSE